MKKTGYILITTIFIFFIFRIFFGSSNSFLSIMSILLIFYAGIGILSVYSYLSKIKVRMMYTLYIIITSPILGVYLFYNWNYSIGVRTLNLLAVIISYIYLIVWYIIGGKSKEILPKKYYIISFLVLLNLLPLVGVYAYSFVNEIDSMSIFSIFQLSTFGIVGSIVICAVMKMRMGNIIYLVIHALYVIALFVFSIRILMTDYNIVPKLLIPILFIIYTVVIYPIFKYGFKLTKTNHISY